VQEYANFQRLQGMEIERKEFIVEGSRKEQVCFYSEIEYFKAEDSTE